MITNQISKIQTDKKLIAFYDKLKMGTVDKYAQIHAKRELAPSGRKESSLIGVNIQDYSAGTGDKNTIVQYNLEPEQVQFILTRVEAGCLSFEWTANKIFGEPDECGRCIAQIVKITRNGVDAKGNPMRSPWNIYIANGRGVKDKNKTGGYYMRSGSFQADKYAYIQLTDMDFYVLLKRVDTYIKNWEILVSAVLVEKGRQAYNAYVAGKAMNSPNPKQLRREYSQLYTQPEYQQPVGYPESDQPHTYTHPTYKYQQPQPVKKDYYGGGYYE